MGPRAVNELLTDREDINYNLRGEYLLTYGAEDTSGNRAEEVQFAMIMADRKPPVIDRALLTGFPPNCECRRNWETTCSVEPGTDTNQCIDAYDQDVSTTLSYTTLDGTPPEVIEDGQGDTISIEALGSYDVEVRAHDYANIFGKNNVNNNAFTTFTVEIVDTTPPEVICQETNHTNRRITCTHTAALMNAQPVKRAALLSWIVKTWTMETMRS
jgi:hypothetical protein